jgi:XTP/dITP diphosphohydrolase
MKTLATEIIICSGNQGKIREFNQAVKDLDLRFTAISEIINEDFDPEETENSFYGNAILKAKAGAKLTNRFCLADDSGIEIDAFEKRPGIYSGRFLKDPNIGFLNDGVFDLSQKLPKEYPQDHSLALETILKAIKDHSVKTCRFICCLVLVDPNGEEVFSHLASWEGKISDSIKGTRGFGYDPIVFPEEFPTKTIAELDSEIKNKLSHRAKATKKLVEYLKNQNL